MARCISGDLDNGCEETTTFEGTFREAGKGGTDSDGTEERGSGRGMFEEVEEEEEEGTEALEGASLEDVTSKETGGTEEETSRETS